MNKKLLLPLVAALPTLLLAASPSANVGPETESPDETSRTITLDDVTVVSTPKEVGALRQQSASATLLGPQQLEAAQVTSLKGITTLVPNLFIPDYGSRLTSAVYIRGIGSRINTPAVGLYVDNIPYVDKSAFDFNFYDIERIDVLRGPQGTLYGRNAMGGIIRIYTRNPFVHTGTDVNLSYATRDNHRTASLMHYHRFGEKFALSAGGYYDGSDGFFTNSTTGQKADPSQAGGGRIRAIYHANQRLSFDLTTSYDYTDEGGYPYFYTGNLTTTETSAEGIGTICNNRESQYRRSLFNAGLNIEYRAPHFVMNAITGYQHLTDCMDLDQDFIAQDIYTLQQKQHIHTLSEELTFRGSDPHSWYQWVTGANVMYQTLHTSGPVTFYEDGVSQVIEGNVNGIFDRLKQDNPRMPAMGITLRDRQFVVSSLMETPSLDLALFHNSTFNWRHWTLNVGLRLDYERLSLDYYSDGNITFDFDIRMSPAMAFNYPDLKASPRFDGSMHHDYLQLLPKVSLMYQLPAQSNIYATVSKGHRSGGYNVQMFSDLVQGEMRSQMISQINEAGQGVVEKMIGAETYQGMTSSGDVNTVVYKPEYSWNYELGTHLNLAGNSLLLDAALFLIETEDQQIARFAPTGLGRMMVNAGESRSYGAEMTALWRPTQALALSANYGYTHAKFTDYDAGDGKDYTDCYVPFVPRHTLGLDASYTWQLPVKWAQNITWGATYNGTGRIYWTESNLTGNGQPASQRYYSTLASRLQLTLNHASLQLWARNLTNTHYNTFYFESASRGFEQHGKPLQIGIDVKFHF